MSMQYERGLPTVSLEDSRDKMLRLVCPKREAFVRQLYKLLPKFAQGMDFQI
jgi:hypothetical protein